jgi:hypothetical protein
MKEQETIEDRLEKPPIWSQNDPKLPFLGTPT